MHRVSLSCTVAQLRFRKEQGEVGPVSRECESDLDDWDYAGMADDQRLRIWQVWLEPDCYDEGLPEGDSPDRPDRNCVHDRNLRRCFRRTDVTNRGREDYWPHCLIQGYYDSHGLQKGLPVDASCGPTGPGADAPDGKPGSCEKPRPDRAAAADNDAIPESDTGFRIR